MTFEKQEIVSATTLVRQFSTYLSYITTSALKKIAIIRNNEMEAVVLPVSEYERLLKIEELSKKKSPKEFFGMMDSDEYKQIEKAIKDCRKVDYNEW